MTTAMLILYAVGCYLLFKHRIITPRPFPAFHGTRLRHAFPILDAADLFQEIGYSLTIGDRSGWLDCLGARWIQEARAQCHFDQPVPRHQAHESAQQSIAPGILEGKAVEGELDPPTEMLTTLI